jgi:L-iditol 2-dehydrogenase
MADLPEIGRMQAIRYAGHGRSCLEEMPVPEPGVGEVLLEVLCCGLCGTDLFKLENDSIPRGTVLGHELVGSVTALGPGVTRFETGQRVVVPHHVACGECSQCQRGSETLCQAFRDNLLVPGGFSEFVLVRAAAVERAARKLPADLPDGAAIFMEPAACVLRGIDRSGLPEPAAASVGAAMVVVLGCGSMGLLHLLVIRSLYRDMRIVVSDPIPERRQLAEALGADSACAPESLDEVVAESSHGAGADVVFDTVGLPTATERALPLTREGGSLVLFAHARPGARLALEMNQLFKHERRVVGTYSGSVDEQGRAFELLASGRLDPTPLISHRLPLRNFQRAVELATQKQALKILLEPSPKDAAHAAS